MYSKYTVKRGMDEEGGVYDRGACEGMDVVREWSSISDSSPKGGRGSA